LTNQHLRPTRNSAVKAVGEPGNPPRHYGTS
jgi:hypothetical protein